MTSSVETSSAVKVKEEADDADSVQSSVEEETEEEEEAEEAATPCAFFCSLPPLSGGYIKTSDGLKQAARDGRFVEVIVRDTVFKQASYWQVPFTAIFKNDWSILRGAMKSSLPADLLPDTDKCDHEKNRQACLYRLIGWSSAVRAHKIDTEQVKEADVWLCDSAKWRRTEWERAGPPTSRARADETSERRTCLKPTLEQRREWMKQDNAIAAAAQIAHNPLWYMRVVLRIDDYDPALHSRTGSSALSRPLISEPVIVAGKRKRSAFEVEDGYVDFSSSSSTVRRVVEENERLAKRLCSLLEASIDNTSQARAIEADRRRARKEAKAFYGFVPLSLQA
jgi:hypothetical protein